MDIDRKLIKRIKKNLDKDAANELISRYYKDIYSYVYKQTIDKELSLDLTQEIFISILKSITRYDEKKSSFRTWIYRIATYNLIDYYRSRNYKYKSRTVTIEDIDIYEAREMETTLENKEDIKEIINILNTLDVNSQQIFRLKIFTEYTFLEISNILEIPESTVKTRCYSAIKKIKKEFEE